MAKQIKAKHGKVKVTLKTKAWFYIMRMLHQRGFNERDDTYWKEKGWLGKARPWK